MPPRCPSEPRPYRTYRATVLYGFQFYNTRGASWHRCSPALSPERANFRMQLFWMLLDGRYSPTVLSRPQYPGNGRLYTPTRNRTHPPQSRFPSLHDVCPALRSHPRPTGHRQDVSDISTVHHPRRFTALALRREAVHRRPVLPTHRHSRNRKTPSP